MRTASHFNQVMVNITIHTKIRQSRAIIEATVPENIPYSTMGDILLCIDDNLRSIQDEMELCVSGLDK